MYPGLVGIGDTPKLQFVGAVLGTPHSPGYPLYIWLSWLFSKLPFGTLAFRINLMSVVCGASAVGLMVLVLRELGCSRIIAFAGALGVGFGRLFWSQMLLAEVYALNALLFAGVLLFLLRWARTRRYADLMWSLVFFAAGLAHHLTLAMTAPALFAFALLVDRHVLTARTVKWAFVICLTGLSCYFFVWLRTYQQAPFLEVRANNLSELIGIMTGRQFSTALFRFSPEELADMRTPMIGTWLLGELRWIGLALAAIGAVWLLLRRYRNLVLLGGSAAMVGAFALNYGVYDIQVFLIIPMIALGLMAGVGIEALRRQAGGRGMLPATIAAAAVVLTFSQYRANFRFNNHHQHTFEAQYFDALFKALPDRSAIVAESYTVDHMVLYKLLGENAAHGRRIEIIPADVNVVRRYAASGFTIYAFANGRAELELKIPFAVANLDLPTASGARHLADTEVQQLAYSPLSVVTLGTGRARAGDPARPPEPMTGAIWRPNPQ
jgi:hypothetical protein